MKLYMNQLSDAGHPGNGFPNDQRKKDDTVFALLAVVTEEIPVIVKGSIVGVECPIIGLKMKMT